MALLRFYRDSPCHVFSTRRRLQLTPTPEVSHFNDKVRLWRTIIAMGYYGLSKQFELNAQFKQDAIFSFPLWKYHVWELIGSLKLWPCGSTETGGIWSAASESTDNVFFRVLLNGYNLLLLHCIASVIVHIFTAGLNKVLLPFGLKRFLQNRLSHVHMFKKNNILTSIKHTEPLHHLQLSPSPFWGHTFFWGPTKVHQVAPSKLAFTAVLKRHNKKLLPLFEPAAL